MEKEFSSRLNELMEDLEISPQKLSELMDVSLDTVYSWKRSEQWQIYINNLVKLCNVLNCSIEFILGYNETVLDFTPKECPPFYDRLRQIMKDKGITRYRLRKDLDIPDGYITAWKKHSPQLNYIIKIARYLNCTIDFLVGRDR